MKQEKVYKRTIAAILAGVLTLGAFNGIGAYFTSTDKASDTYTIGNVEIELSGESNDFKQKKLLPLEEYDYQREVTNIGLNSAYVYMTVSIPYIETETNNANDGTILEKADFTQVLTYGIKGDEETAKAGVNSQFKLVENGRVGDISISEVSTHSITGASDTKGAVDEAHQCITYVYAYVDEEGNLAKLAPDANTGYLFDLLKVANLADNYNMQEYGSIIMNAYGIQTNNILTDNKFTGSEVDGTTDIEEVWSVIQNACAVPTVPYNMLNAQNIVPGEAATFRSEADLGKLEAVYIDGDLVDAENYEASEGSTIITLKADYTETLDLGSHMLEIKSSNGSAYHEFTVANVDAPVFESVTLTNENDGAQQSMINIAGADYRVLAVEDGKAFLMQDKVADWNNNLHTIFGSSAYYDGSNVDTYLEGIIYPQLKEELGENAIVSTTLSSESLGDDQAPLTRHIYALSKDEVLNTAYGFKDEHTSPWGYADDDDARVALDDDNEPFDWWLRSAVDYYDICVVDIWGGVSDISYDADNNRTRAAFWLNLDEVDITGENHQYIAGHDWKVLSEEPASCTAKGQQLCICSLCNRETIKTINKLPHTIINGICSTCGEEVFTNANDGAQQSMINIAGVDYRVLAVEDGRAFLMQDKPDAVWNANQNTPFGTSVNYNGSYLDAYLEGTLYEQLKAELGENAIAETVLSSDSLGDGQSALTRHVYALSKDEVLNTAYGFKTDDMFEDGFNLSRILFDFDGVYPWWLRTANVSFVYLVSEDGSIYDTMCSHEYLRARSALWLNLDEVILSGGNHQYVAIAK